MPEVYEPMNRDRTVTIVADCTLFIRTRQVYLETACTTGQTFPAEDVTQYSFEQAGTAVSID